MQKTYSFERRVGHLGLEIIDVNPFAEIGNSFMIRVGGLLEAPRKSTAGQIFERSLRADPRVAAMAGKTVLQGSSGHRFEITHLVDWYFWRANVVGHDQALADLEAYLDADEVTTLKAFWLWGVVCSSPIEIAEGLQLLPAEAMPLSADKERFMAAGLNRTIPMFPAPQVAMVLEQHGPKLASVDNEIKGDGGYLTHRRMRDIALLMNSLPGVTCAVAFETDYSPDHVAPGNFWGGGGMSPSRDVVVTRECEVTKSQFAELPAVYAGFTKLPEERQRLMRRALSRLAQAKGRNDDSDAALDLGIALEMVLIDAEHSGEGMPAQLGMQFRLRGAWLLGSDVEGRRLVSRTLRDIYQRRSQVAHKGVAAFKDRATEASAAFKVAEDIMRRLALNGRPDWDDLLLGGGLVEDHSD